MVYGYIYLTQNTVTGDVYVGKHKASVYDPEYYGSGKIVMEQLRLYGCSAFKNRILATAETKDDPNSLEKQFIERFKQQYRERCLNIAPGGDGGDTFTGKPQNEKDMFVQKMTGINKTRCSTPQFRQATAERMSAKYKSMTARQTQSEKVRETWSDPQLRSDQSQRLKKYYSTHKKDQSYLRRPCLMELNGTILRFPSVKDLRSYLTSQFRYTPDRRTFQKLMENGKNGIPFKPFHKTKYANLAGMRIYYE